MTISQSAFIKDISADHLACRDIRHAWSTPTHYETRGKQTVRAMICSRCSARKYQVLFRGQLVSSAMKFPDGYLKPKDVEPGRIERSVILNESLNRSRQVKPTGDVWDFMERRGLL